MNLKEYIKKNNKRYVIFDFDATLFHLVVPWDRMKDEQLARLREIDAMLWGQCDRGEITFTQLLNESIDKHGNGVREYLNDHAATYEVDNIERYKPNHELLEVLSELEVMPDITLYLWSSNARPVIDTILKENGMENYFDKIITRQDSWRMKPHADGFDLIYDKDTEKSAYLMVGDSSHDRGAAEAAGIDFYLVDFFNLGR